MQMQLIGIQPTVPAHRYWGIYYSGTYLVQRADAGIEDGPILLWSRTL